VGRELRGLTWDHPRGYRVLDAVAGMLAPGVVVRWDRQPLEDFESRPLRTLAGDYDLLVVDHPGLGEAVRDGALHPLDRLFTPDELARWRAGSAGASFDSYRLAGRQWALPLDAAAQVAVTRPDLTAARPAGWAEAVQLADTVPTALCLGGPHALLMFSAICLAAGSPPAADGPEFVTAAAGTGALEVMAALLERADRDLAMRNPIAVLDAMATDDGPAYCPLVYGYISYQRPDGDPGPHRLSFFDAPAGAAGIGSVLGGTGLAVSRSCTQLQTAATLIRTLLSGPVQTRVFAAQGGQSATADAWLDPGVDAASGGFYRATWATVRQAWVRPRFAGYLEFQAAASEVLRAGLLARAAPGRLVSRVNELFAEAGQAKPAGGRPGRGQQGRTG
jgi:multiple sugar transport system substrate-binding protein